MMDVTITGLDIYCTYVFQAILHPDRERWIYTNTQMGGFGYIYGGIEGVVSQILTLYPAVDRIDYRDADGRLHTSYPSQAQPNRLAMLVTEELTK